MFQTATVFLCWVLALTPGLAFAQSTPAQAEIKHRDRPLTSDTYIRGAVPGVRATPGVILYSENPSMVCSHSADMAAQGFMTPQDAVMKCNDAITSGVMAVPDLAGTYVNRGVLLLIMGQPGDAKRDFEQALQIQPSKAEALVNLAIIDHADGRLHPALEKLEQALALGPEHPERAYLTRGMVREDLKDVRGAYSDYKAAETLRPGWEPVMRELARFQVRTAEDAR
jgi:tetratricopeptide (TPR) repeat protein